MYGTTYDNFKENLKSVLYFQVSLPRLPKNKNIVTRELFGFRNEEVIFPDTYINNKKFSNQDPFLELFSMLKLGFLTPFKKPSKTEKCIFFNSRKDTPFESTLHKIEDGFFCPKDGNFKYKYCIPLEQIKETENCSCSN